MGKVQKHQTENQTCSGDALFTVAEVESNGRANLSPPPMPLSYGFRLEKEKILETSMG